MSRSMPAGTRVGPSRLAGEDPRGRKGEATQEARTNAQEGRRAAARRPEDTGSIINVPVPSPLLPWGTGKHFHFLPERGNSYNAN